MDGEKADWIKRQLTWHKEREKQFCKNINHWVER